MLVSVCTDGTPLLISINENTKNHEINRFLTTFTFLVYITLQRLIYTGCSGDV